MKSKTLTDHSQFLKNAYVLDITDSSGTTMNGGVLYVDKFETGALGSEVEAGTVEHWALSEHWANIVDASNTRGSKFTVEFTYDPSKYANLAAFQQDVANGDIDGTTIVRYIECRCFQLPKV